MEKKSITEKEYNQLLEQSLGMKNATVAIDIYEFLKNKTTKIKSACGNYVILENPHLSFLDGFFLGSMSPYGHDFTDVEKEFLKSDYLSDELKKEIYNRIKNSSEKLTELLNSENHINVFSKETIKEIIGLLKSASSKAKEDYVDFCNLFEEYLFVLDGNGPIGYIKEKYGKDLPIEMLKRSNIINDASHYEGYGVERSILGEWHLFSLYRKFAKYYPEKVDEFVEMIRSIQLLTPTNFIINYSYFVENGLNSNFKIKESNNSKEDSYGSKIMLTSAISIISLVNEKQRNSDIHHELEAQHSIIDEFIKMIEQFKKTQESEQSEDNNTTDVKRFIKV